MFGIEVLEWRVQEIRITIGVRHFQENLAIGRTEADKRGNGCIHVLNVLQNSGESDQIEAVDIRRQISDSALVCLDSLGLNVSDANGRRIDPGQMAESPRSE